MKKNSQATGRAAWLMLVNGFDQPPPTEPLACAETSTETETFAWICVDAFTTAATWPLMQRAWSLNELTNFGPISASSAPVATVVLTAIWGVVSMMPEMVRYLKIKRM